MVLSWVTGGGAPSGATISELIAKKQYAKAIEAIRAQLQAGKHNPQLHLQLADVLVLAGKSKEAVQILSRVADDFAKEGFDTKAIAVLKKIEKIEPGRWETRAKLDSLVRKGRAETAPSVASAGGGFEIGMEEIGIEGPPQSVVSEPAPIPVAPAPPPPPPPAPKPRPAPRASAPETPALDLGFDFGASAPALDGELHLDDAGPIDLGLETPAPPRPAPRPPARTAPKPPPPPAPAPVQDLDFGTGEEEEEEPPAVEVSPLELEPEAEAEIVPEPLEVEPAIELSEVTLEPEAGAEEIAAEGAGSSSTNVFDELFTQELMGVIDEVFQAVGGDEGDTRRSAASAAGHELAQNPLFRGFSSEELAAIIEGLNLHTYEAGDMILSQGAPGNSLFIVTTGTVKAFVRSDDGKYNMVSELEEGSFFGEVSILTGSPRTATIVAAGHVELLELDRGTLDAIAIAHPHVMQVLEDFYRERTQAR